MSRRNKREPFNPFAPGASAKPQKKPQKRRDEVVKTDASTLSRQEKMAAMRRKIREQQEKKRIAEEEKSNKKIHVEEVIKKEEVIKTEEIIDEGKDSNEQQELVPNIVETEVKINVKDDAESKKDDKIQEKSKIKENTAKESEESLDKESTKLDDLKRRSDELAAKTGISLPKENYKGSLFSTKKPISSGEKVKAAPKKIVRKTKKGGGKQPKQKKLNRRKQLEFRFDARAILDNSSVAEEHRSNIFGQIWAKGERVGIDSAIEYVTQKQQEGILTEDVSNELVGLIRSYTIKR